MTLCEKYQPRTIADFIGLEKPKKRLTNFISRPSRLAFLFIGRSGTGKTAMGQALATDLGAELHSLPAAECSRENIAELWAYCCEGAPARRHLILIDNADTLTQPRQITLRSKLDGHEGGKNVIRVFTAAANKLDEDLATRCLQVAFSSYGMAPQAASHLERIWAAEAPPGARAPNFARIVKEANGNMRAALNRLESKIAAL